MSLVRFRPEAPFADLAHLVERHLAKVEVASSSLVIRSIFLQHNKVPEPSGKASVCKTEIPRFKSGWYLQKKPRRKTRFFQRYKSTAWICDIRFACDIRLRRVICLRAWVDLYHITFGVSRIYRNLRQQIISHLAQARYITKNLQGLDFINQN